MRANVVFRSAVALALLFILSLSGYSRQIRLDGSLYFLGQEVSIAINSSLEPGLRLDISDGSSVFSYFGSQNNFIFTPRSTGYYTVELINFSSKDVRETAGFSVISPSEASLFTDKTGYVLGETVLIYLETGHNQDYNITISNSKEIFFFLGELQSPLRFFPRSAGEYQISLFSNQSSIQRNFSVGNFDSSKIKGSFKVSSQKKEYTLGEEVVLKTAFPRNESFEFYIKSGANVYRFFGIPEQNLVFIPKEAGEYEATIEHAGIILASYKFIVFDRPSSWRLSQLINYTFTLGEDAGIEVDFTNEVDAVRDVIELALKKTKLQQLTAYIDGHAADSNFNLTLEHEGLDKFLIKIKSNKNIQADIYRLVAVAEYDGKKYIQNIVFGWGANDSDYFVQKAEKMLQNNTTLNETPVTATLNESFNETFNPPLNGTANATVNEPFNGPLSPENFTLYTDKSNYTLGEVVAIHLNAEASAIQIVHDKEVFYILNFSQSASFVPLSEGVFFVEAQIKGHSEVLLAEFLVQPNKSAMFIAGKKTPIRLRDSRQESLQANIKFYKAGALIREIEENKLASQDSIAEGRYNVEIQPKGQPVKKIVLNDLDFKGTLDFGIERGFWRLVSGYC